MQRNSGKEIKFEYNSIAPGTYVGLYKPKQKKKEIKPPTAPLQYARVRAFEWGIKIRLNKED